MENEKVIQDMLKEGVYPPRNQFLRRDVVKVAFRMDDIHPDIHDKFPQRVLAKTLANT